jgi:hypothetical protein
MRWFWQKRNPVQAWVVFDVSTDTPEIIEGFNVSSVTSCGMGQYRIKSKRRAGLLQRAFSGLRHSVKAKEAK